MPGGPVRPPGIGAYERGYLMGRARWAPVARRVDVVQPAAGGGWSRTNDSGGTWVIRSLAFTLTTDANAGNRFITMAATAGEDIWFRTTSQFAHPATRAINYSAWDGSPATTVDSGGVLIPWAQGGLWLPPGQVLSLAVTGVFAGDQVSAIFLQVIELPETLPASLMPMITTFVEQDEE